MVKPSQSLADRAGETVDATRAFLAASTVSVVPSAPIQYRYGSSTC
jgi:hypothetical protein